MRLIFLGAPGVGKGTQAHLLQEVHGVVHISSGDLLREAAKHKDATGRAIQQAIQSGSLVPDALVEGLIFQKIRSLRPRQSFSLDGFPRTVEQAQALETMLGEARGAPIDRVIDFEMKPDVVIRRLSGRRVCEECGVIYHIENLRPRVDGVCDRCKAVLATRPDDEPETIRKRLEVYQEQTAPLLDFYKRSAKLCELPGDLSVEEQYNRMMKLLEREQLV